MRHYTTAEAMEIINGYTFRNPSPEGDGASDSAANSVNRLTKRVSESDARFVFELLQNADDNFFEEAVEQKALPSISFQIHPNHIVMDCNEDGFRKEDIDAICNVGKTTKTGHRHGYIGAKDIGFKSVFIVAEEVHIQSGAFSFRFSHREDDTGSGMVTPFWVPAENGQTLDTPLTRMTLRLRDQGDPVKLEKLRNDILGQFNDLTQTCLLFLEKLQRITIEIYDKKGSLKESRTLRKDKVDEYRVYLETQTKDAISTQIPVKKLYHVTKHQATDIPRSVDEEPSDVANDEIFGTADVVLAFPLTHDYKPDTTIKHDVYAFLPIRTSDYSFIIHSNFDTNANEKSFFTTSKRNLKLREEIANTFVTAVLEFCEHPALCYLWPRFLPYKLDFVSDDKHFWSVVNAEISSRLGNTPILKSRSGNELHLVGNVKELIPQALIGDELIYDDINSEYFIISPKYSIREISNLGNWIDIRMVSVSRLFKLIKMDLYSFNSKMRSSKTTEEWHSRAADFICVLFKEFKNLQQPFRALHLIPLRDGHWCSASPSQVYFDTYRDINIPSLLNMKVVETKAAANPARRKLFECLGVAEINHDEVRHSILQQFQSADSLQVSSSVELLHYFYKILEHENKTQTETTGIPVVTLDGIPELPSETDVYLPAHKNPYGPRALLGRDINNGKHAIHFLHDKYMENVPERLSANQPSWERWLYDSVGIRERIRLASRDMTRLDKTFLYVLKKNPKKFLGLLKYLWTFEMMGKNPIREYGLQVAIMNLPAKELCDVDYSLKLSQTWLPYQKLRDITQQYMDHPKTFPFLEFEEPETDDSMDTNWDFLISHLKLGTKESTDFLLEILQRIKLSTQGSISARQTQMVFELYVAIEARFSASACYEKQMEQKKIKDFFRSREVIFIPDQEATIWANPSGCLWSAPSEMRLVFRLQSLYATRLNFDQMQSMKTLFRDVINLNSASMQDLIGELEFLRDNGSVGDEEISNIYRYMNEMSLEKQNIRNAFETKNLICVKESGKNRWYKSSECLWSSTIPIHGKAILDNQYESLKAFFIGTLDVKCLNINILYNEIAESEQPASKDETRIILLCFSDFLRATSTDLEPTPILKANIYPLRHHNGIIVMGTAKQDFAIADQIYLKEKFQDKITLLDFELEDIHRLQPFFHWSGLERRYISAIVQEKIQVMDELRRPVSNLDRDLKRKAYHILRIAATFSSSRYQNDPNGLYQNLRTIKVIETDEISCELEILQNETRFTANEGIGSGYIDESSSPLTLYVPRKENMQDICFCSFLPKKFARWLLQVDNNVEIIQADAICSILTAVFMAERSSLKEILDRQGIVKVPIVNKDHEVDNEEESTQELQEDQRDSINKTSNTISFSPKTGKTSIPSPSSLSHSDIRQTTTPSPEPQYVFGGKSPTPLVSSWTASHFVKPPKEQELYCLMLRQVISIAQNAAFPSYKTFHTSGMRHTLSSAPDKTTIDSFDGLDMVFDFRIEGFFERAKKLGAAGELYVFELLSEHKLSGWGRDNWQSRIRSYVKICPQYATIGDWGRTEMADFIYDDTQGQFTRLLIYHGYVPETWCSRRPKYFLVVKTTTGPCDTRFSMSHDQYNLIRDTHLNDDNHNVYLIVRVFWMGSDRVGACIYLDPEQPNPYRRPKSSVAKPLFFK